MNQKTTLKKVKDIKHKWYLIDATDQVLGRISTQIAVLLRGRDDVDYTPFYDQGNYVIVTNVSKIKITGDKLQNKMYYKYTGYMGNLKESTMEVKMKKDPTKVLLLAVKRMLPKNKLAKDQIERLKMYAGAEHPHAGQLPTLINLSNLV